MPPPFARLDMPAFRPWGRPLRHSLNSSMRLGARRLPEEGERREGLPARAAKASQSPWSRRRGGGDADRPSRPLDLRSVRHREADRGRRGTVPLACRVVGRHQQQHRPPDARRPWRTGRRGARSNPHPHGRGSQPSQGAWGAYVCFGVELALTHSR